MHVTMKTDTINGIFLFKINWWFFFKLIRTFSGHNGLNIVVCGSSGVK